MHPFRQDRLGAYPLCAYPMIVLAIIIGLSIPAWALTIESDQQLEYADQLFNNRQYLRAAEEYQRFTFFYPDHPDLRKVHFKAGESFLFAQKPDYAIGMWAPLTAIKPFDELAVEAFFKIADAYLQSKEPTRAVVQLNHLIARSDDKMIRDRAHYRIGWIHIDLADWATANNAFNKISPGGRDLYRLGELDQALMQAADLPTKSPALAGTLSIIPGVGQLYCRRPQDALIAFAVNAGLIWAAHDAFDNEQYGLGGLLAFVGFGFYAGNIYGAVNDAHKYNRQLTGQFTDQLHRHELELTRSPQDATQNRRIVLGFRIPF